MANRTSIASGLWSAAGTWDTGVPADNDTVTIVADHTVVFNVDQSAFPNGVDLTVNGILECKETAGAYYLMSSSDIDGAGVFRAGGPSMPLSTDVTFTIDFDGNGNSFECAGGLDLQLYCTEPTHKYIKLSANEAAGQTVLSVDIDVTSDLWAVGDVVHIDNIDEGNNSEERTIAAGGIAADTITVTVGLTGAKLAGALVVLIKRNIRIIGSTNYPVKQGTGIVVCAEISSCTFGVYGGSGCTIGGVLDVTSYGIREATDFSITGVISGCTYGVANARGIVISGVVSGCQSGLYYCSNANIEGLFSGCYYGINFGVGCTINGIVSGCRFGTYYNNGLVVAGEISKCRYGIGYSDAPKVTGVFDGNDNDLYRVSPVTCYNTSFSGTVENSGYNTDYVAAHHYVASFDHDQVAGAFKAWCRGGIITSQTASPPGGYDVYFKHGCEDADNYCFRQLDYIVGPGDTLKVKGKIKLENGDDHAAYPPRLQVIDPFSDPLVDAGDSPLATDSVDESDGTTNHDWQDVAVEWENTGSLSRKVLVRICCSHATADVYSVWKDVSYLTVDVPADYTSGSVTVSYNAGTGVMSIIGGTEGTPARYADLYKYSEDNNLGVVCCLAGDQYVVKCNVEFGNGTDSTYFQSTDEEVYFADSKTFAVKEEAVLELGDLYGSWGINGSMWSVKPSANMFVTQNNAGNKGNYKMYASLLKNRANKIIDWHGGSVDIRNSIFCGIYNGVNTSSKPYFEQGVAEDDFILRDFYITNVASFSRHASMDDSMGVWIHRTYEGVAFSRDDLVMHNIKVTSGIHDCFLNVGSDNAQLVNPEWFISSPYIITDDKYIQSAYTVNVCVCDPDGKELDDVVVAATRSSLVVGSDSNVYRCIQDVVGVVDAVHKPITGSSWSDYFELTIHVTGGDWITGADYVADEDVFSVVTGAQAGIATDGVNGYIDLTTTSGYLNDLRAGDLAFIAIGNVDSGAANFSKFFSGHTAASELYLSRTDEEETLCFGWKGTTGWWTGEHLSFAYGQPHSFVAVHDQSAATGWLHVDGALESTDNATGGPLEIDPGKIRLGARADTGAAKGKFDFGFFAVLDLSGCTVDAAFALSLAQVINTACENYDYDPERIRQAIVAVDANIAGVYWALDDAGTSGVFASSSVTARDIGTVVGGSAKAGFGGTSSVAGCSGTGLDLDPGAVSQQIVNVKKWVGTAEDSYQWDYKFTFTHADYPDFVVSDALIDGLIDWRVEMGISTSDLETAVQNVIESNNLDHLLKVPVMPADVVDDTIIAKVVSSAEFDQWVTYNSYVDSLQGISERQWAADERNNIRYQLGVNGSQIAPYSNTPNLATGSEVGTVKTIVDKLDTAMEADGVVYRFTDNALEQGVAGGFGATDRDKLDTLILYAKEN